MNTAELVFLTVAAFIVRVVNAHEELLDVLKRWNRAMEQGTYPELSGIWDDTIQAIAKAEGK